jgi:biotin transport system substrate-specific component
MSVRAARLEAPGTLLTTVVGPAALDRGVWLFATLVVTGLTALAAQVSIPMPFTPVPFTLQPMVVLLGGAALGARLGMLSQVLYLALGIAGFPVFAVSPLPQGVLRLLGPTGGYLMSYPFAAYLTGALAERGFDRSYRSSVVAMGAGLALIFACGIAWLAWFTRPVPAGLDAALRTGLYPFLPADLVKICLAAGVMPSIWALLGRRSSSGDSRPQGH